VKLTFIIEAHQWFKNGDHPDDKCVPIVATGKVEDGFKAGEIFQSEGKVVRYFRHPQIDGRSICDKCGKTMHDHGWIDSSGGGQNVCPGDWVITDEVGKGGKYFAVSEETFKKVLEKCLTKHCDPIKEEESHENPSA
jgi:hypothetical protein